MRNLRGRTAIITGASWGIGVHVARALAEEGINLVLAARTADALNEVRDEAERLGVRAVAVATDVSDIRALESLVERALSEFGAIDVLVNNAGVQLTLRYDELTVDEIEEIVRVNLRAPMLLSWLVLPGMIDRGRGHIVNMSSLGGRIGTAYAEPYCATKAGLIAFTQSLRATYHGSGVSASVILPGFVEAGMYAQAKQESGVEAPRMVGTSRPEGVGSAVVRSIRKDLPEAIVNPGPTRLMLAVATLAPGLAESFSRRTGMADAAHRIAEQRRRQRAASGHHTRTRS